MKTCFDIDTWYYPVWIYPAHFDKEYNRYRTNGDKKDVIIIDTMFDFSKLKEGVYVENEFLLGMVIDENKNVYTMKPSDPDYLIYNLWENGDLKLSEVMTIIKL